MCTCLILVLTNYFTETLNFLQNTTVTLGNDTVISNSMKDNPHMHYYAGIYALSMAVMLILKAVRGVVFVKVCANAVVFLPPPPCPPYFCILLSLWFFWSPPRREF